MSNHPLLIQTFLLIGYVFSAICLNVIAYLISGFYQKKFEQSSPKFGFIIAIFLALLFVLIMLIGKHTSYIIQIITVMALLGSGLSSALSMVNLYITMRKVRK